MGYEYSPMTYPQQRFYYTAAEVKAWMGNHISRKTVDVNTYPCLNHCLLFVIWTPGNIVVRIGVNLISILRTIAMEIIVDPRVYTVWEAEGMKWSWLYDTL